MTEENKSEAEKLLRLAEAKYRELFDNTLNAILVHEASTGKVLEVNGRATEITGYSKEELLEGHLEIFVTDHVDYSIEKIRHYIDLALEGLPQNFEWYGKEKDGTPHWYEVALKKAVIVGEERVLTFFRIIDERKEADSKMAASEKRFRHTLDNMMEGAQIIGRDWRYLYVNDALVRQSRLTREELLGFTMMEKFPGIEQTEMFVDFRKCMEGQRSFQLENKFIFPDKTIGWFNLRVETVDEGIFILSADITERKKAEEDIRKMNENLEEIVQERTKQLMEVNKALEAFSYSVSHDLRSPLRAINGYAKLLEQEYGVGLEKEGQRLIQVIRHNTRKMGKLIDHILEFARLGKAALSKTKVNIQKIAEDSWDEQFGYSDKVATVSIGTLHPANADKAMIAIVFANLISNAIKYSAKSTQPHIIINSVASDGEIIYSVQDNGVGFDMRYADKLFAVFQRLHRPVEFEGVGVGLALVECIVSKHGGRIWAESEVGKGATFYFSVPVGKEQ